MEQVGALLTMQGQLGLLVAVGFLLRRIGVVDENGKKLLTDLVIDLILPCNIIQSFRIAFSWDILRQTLSIFLVSAALQIGCALLAAFGCRRFPHEKKAVLQYGLVTSNAGFLGTPLAEGVFGGDGVLLASIYLIPQRIVMWSTGVGYFTGGGGQSRRAVVKKTLTHPCIIACFIGMFLLLTQFQLPAFLGNTIKSLSGCNTAFSMLLIGTIMGESRMGGFFKADVLIYCFVRLALIPGAVLLGCRLCEVNALVTGVAVLLAAMPMGGTTPVLAAKYGCDADFAVRCTVVSTVLSLLTTPLWCLVF